MVERVNKGKNEKGGNKWGTNTRENARLKKFGCLLTLESAESRGAADQRRSKGVTDKLEETAEEEMKEDTARSLERPTTAGSRSFGSIGSRS
jgi:hypothetical protein